MDIFEVTVSDSSLGSYAMLYGADDEGHAAEQVELILSSGERIIGVRRLSWAEMREGGE